MQMQNSIGRELYYFDAFKVKVYEYYFNLFFRDWNYLLMVDLLLSLITELQIMNH